MLAAMLVAVSACRSSSSTSTMAGTSTRGTAMLGFVRRAPLLLFAVATLPCSMR